MKIVFNLLKEIALISFFVVFLSFPVFSQEGYPYNKIDFDYKIFPLPGSLNDVPVFNSNSPELIKSEGILLSTFSPENKNYPEAHLNMKFKGKFDIFAHHIALQRDDGDFTNLYEGIILQNSSPKIVTLKILASATYLTRPDAPFLKLPDYLENSDEQYFSGPGDRTSQDILRGKNIFENNIFRINPGDYFVLMNEAIPIAPLSASNGRTSMFKLESDGPLFVADLALYEKDFLFLKDQKPEPEDWINILKSGRLAVLRDNTPSPLDSRWYDKPFYYGRVGGVAIGDKWKARIENKKNEFKIPPKNQGVVFVVNSLFGNTYATAQIQSGVIVRRYPDTALQSHGNYGVTYEIEIPLFNGNNESTSVTISFDTPLRFLNDKKERVISYYDYPPDKINFRGEFLVQYKSYLGLEKEKYIHVIQRFGQQGLPLASIFMDPGEKRLVKITFIYPSDATPPHVLTITSN
jgi:hypothetical protein